MDNIKYTWNYLGQLLDQIEELDEKITSFSNKMSNGLRPNYAEHIMNLNWAYEMIMLFEEISNVLETLYEQKELSQDNYENKMVGIQKHLQKWKEFKEVVEKCMSRFH